VQTSFNEVSASVSPDGRWLAYVSDESGRYETYVQSFPTAGRKYQVTWQGSGPWVRWRGDGRELAMIDGARRELLTADIKGGANLQTGPPRRMMSLPPNHLGIDITRDFQRVLVIVPTEGSAPSIVVVTDWLAGLKK
jgi:eukaryotic-like serine/threonine-protein kinase